MDDQLLSDPYILEVNDILEYRCPRFGVVWQWRVYSVCFGAAGQQSLIELVPVLARPGQGTDGVHETMWVPEQLTRGLRVFRPKN